jgi:hypothetical protein
LHLDDSGPPLRGNPRTAAASGGAVRQGFGMAIDRIMLPLSATSKSGR